MRFFPPRPTDAARGAFTLAEVLAAMLVMAIVIPVALQGLGVASRAGLAGTRKAAAMRVAERVLNEQFVTGQLSQSSTGGSTTEGDTTYQWTLESANWPQDAMTQVTVQVTFTVQGHDYAVSASTLFDPLAPGLTTTPTLAAR
jgi:type II secretory pathway pseudopilin PulG